MITFAAERGIHVVPFGAGSGVCGGVLPDAGSVVMDLKRMRAIRRVDTDRLLCEAEAGILGQHLEDGLDARGFTLGHFPSSIYCSTLGGWLAARSAGQCSGRYGKIEDMVVGLTCVDGSGRVREARRGELDGALLPLVVGSEGVLAVITDATLRIAPTPPARRFASFSFRSVEAGVDAARHIYQAGLRPAVARLYDPFDTFVAKRSRGAGGAEHAHSESRPGLGVRLLARALRRPGLLNKLVDGLPEAVLGGSMLVLIWEDDPTIADAELALATRIAERAGGRDGGEAPAQRWFETRYSVSYRQSPMYAAGAFVDTMEVAATWSRLLPVYHAVRDALAPHVFVMAHFSHAYPDGASIYFTFAGAARDDAAALEVYDQTWRDALAATIDAGGTLSHHHGVGRSKAPAMRREQGAAVDVVRLLKREMDPAGILNPGALIPENGADAHVP